MHQSVISYESSMRVNNSREQRKYVAKRTCLSVIFTVAFFTMTAGFLLGKFISDRHHYMQLLATAEHTAIRSENSVELSSVDFKNLKQLRSYQQAKDSLLAAARQLSEDLQRNNNSNYLPSSLNTEIFNKYISCAQDIPPNTNIESSKFIEELINNTAERQRDCMRIIQMIIESNLANG